MLQRCMLSHLSEACRVIHIFVDGGKLARGNYLDDDEGIDEGKNDKRLDEVKKGY